MVKYIKAKQGYKFVLTEFGSEQPHVRGKYNRADGKYNKMYDTSVPQAWVEKGYVEGVQYG